MNQTDLINDLLKRTDGSLEQLKLHYGPLIRYVITPILPDARDREEVFNDILVRIWDRADQFDPKQGSWTNWLSTTARNAAIDRVRSNPPPSAELVETIQNCSNCIPVYYPRRDPRTLLNFSQAPEFRSGAISLHIKTTDEQRAEPFIGGFAWDIKSISALPYYIIESCCRIQAK